MDVVGSDQLDIMFAGEFDQDLIHFLLFGIRGAIGVRVVCFVPLHFQVIIFSEQFFEPQDGFFCFIYPIMHNMLRYFATQTSGTDNQVFVIFLQ